MTDPFRGGGFGSVGMGPFTTGGGGDSRYLIANDGANVAAARKYSAQVAWANGTITDEAYLSTLRWYVGQTDKGSRERTAAENELSDATYTIGRNKIVRAVNNAPSGVMRVAALRKLIGYDRQKLSTMQRDNEQYRELQDKIASSQASIREARYSDLILRYNADKVSSKSVLAFVRNMAAEARGQADQATWTSRITQMQQAVDTEQLNALYQDFQHERIPGSTVIDFLKGMRSRMDPSSPDYADTSRRIEDLQTQITEKSRSDKDAEMSDRLSAGAITDAEYLKYLRSRVDDYKKGTPERRRAEDNLLQTTFGLGEQSLKDRITAGTAQPTDLVDFYRSYQATMNPSSSKFLEINNLISNLLVQGSGALAVLPGGGPGQSGSSLGGYGVGRWVNLSGAPGGTPVDARGFASQFDGSAFANSNCGMASAAMLAWAATDGRLRLSGGDLRYYSGDRDQPGDEAGTAFSDIQRAYEAVGLGLEARHGMDFAAWKQRLARGEGSIIQGDYSVVPNNLRLSSFQGAHAMYVDRATKIKGQWYFYVMDPLGRAGYNGQWWPEAAIKAYGWSGLPSPGGDRWLGDVAFATGKGRSKTFYGQTRAAPPFQAFDTDANGNSTVGRGGGTSRAEAGRRRDWSKGREKDPLDPKTQFTGTRKGGNAPTLKPTGASPEAVAEFLAAVQTTSRPAFGGLPGFGATVPAQGGEQQALEARAKAVLEANQMDARLAAVAWFTGGEAVNPDTSTWTPTMRFYANAVGPRLGYDPIPRGGVGDIDPNKPRTVLTPTAPTAPLDLVSSGAQPTDKQSSLAGLPGDTVRMSTEILHDLGVPATPDMVRAVAAWIVAENGNTVGGNNPLGLKTMGTQDLPGQLAKDPQTGLAVFATVEDGAQAAADEIRRSEPGLIAAARSGDPERFLVMLDRSGWKEGGYGGALVSTYNALPGNTRMIIGGTGGLLKSAGDLASLARQAPSVAELFDVDPRDPAQMTWLQANIDSMKDANTHGASTWDYIAPDGSSITLDFHTSMLGDLTASKAALLDWKASGTGPGNDHMKALEAAKDAWREHNSLVVDISMEEWDSQIKAIDRQRDYAKLTMDLPTYINLTHEMAAATANLLGIDPSRADTSFNIADSPLRTMLTKDQQDRVVHLLDSIGDRSPTNPSGDPITAMVTTLELPITTDSRGNVTGVTLDPNTVFVTQEVDPITQQVTPKWHTRATDPTAFEPGEPVVVGNQTMDQPRYLQTMRYVQSGGAGFYVPIQQGSVRVSVLDPAGNRTTTIPAPSGGTGRSAWLGSQPGAGQWFGGNIPNDLAGAGTPPTASGASFANEVQGLGATVTVSTAQRDDMVLRPTGIMANVDMISFKDPVSGKWVRMYHLPGGNQWIGGPDDLVNASPLQLVLDPSTGITVKNGKLQVNGEDYDPTKHGDLSKHGHWYGTKPTDTATGDKGTPALGAPNTYAKMRSEQVGPGGSINAISYGPTSEAEAFLEGDIGFMDLLGGGWGKRDAAPGRRSTSMVRPEVPGDLSRGNAGGTQRDVPRGMPASMGITAQQQAGIDSVFAQIEGGAGPRGPVTMPDIGTIARMNLPITAGARRVEPASMPSFLTAFNANLANSVRSFADGAQKAIAAQQQIREQQALVAQKIAAQQAAAAKQVTMVVPKNVAPIASQPIATAKPPTPKPTPAPVKPTPGPAPSPPAKPVYGPRTTPVNQGPVLE